MKDGNLIVLCIRISCIYLNTRYSLFMSVKEEGMYTEFKYILIQAYAYHYSI